jgi:serine protease inhibitor ecotin
MCKHRLLVAALEGKTLDTEGFEYTRRKKVVKQEETLQLE